MLSMHLARHKNGYACKIDVCEICNETYPFLHRKIHNQLHTIGHTQPVRDTTQPTIRPLEIDAAYENIYTQFAQYIRPSIKEGRRSTVYNFQLSGFTAQSICDHVIEIFNAQPAAFKIAISIGCILKNNETGELSYFWPSQNNQLLLDSPLLIRNESDMLNLCATIRQKDIQKHVHYPNTKYIFVRCTNISFYVTKLLGVAIGAPITLPDFLKNNKGLHSLTSSEKSGKPYTDKLCFFRALALHRGEKISALELLAKQLLKQFCDRTAIAVNDFNGISLDELEDISNIFDIGINLYEQKQDHKGERVTNLIYRSVKQDNVLYLNLFDDHFSYIKNLDKYSTSYLCPKCRKIWTHHGNFRRHLKTCDAATRDIYCNGTYRPTLTVFEHLEKYDIDVPQEDRFYPYRICYDVECYLNPEFEQANSVKVSYSHEHILASISVCSNTPGFTKPRCFISDGNQRDLVKNMIEYMNEISFTAKALLEEKYDEYISQIEELDDEKLEDKFEIWLSQIPSISFNGSRWVIMLYFIKIWLFCKVIIIHFGCLCF